MLIMMGQHDRSEALFYYFRLEDQVPETHLLRLIERHISFAFVRERLKQSYSETGRPSIDPELLLRILLIGYLYGITSERKLVYLGLSVRFSNKREILLAILAVVTIYLARPLLVRTTLRGISPGWEDSSLASVMVPKGLASAVLASVPLRMGLLGGETVQSFAYMVVLFSILTTALLVPLLRRPAVASLCRSFFKS